MKFQIITIGKKHDRNLEDFILDLENRIKGDFEIGWTILKSEDHTNKSIQIKKESEKILKSINKEDKNSFLILLDENGKQKSSLELANFFEEKMNTGVNKIIFIIGGAFGVEYEIKNKVDFIISLSKLVFPHQLVRVILIEQIYRSISILKGGKYHHE